MIYLDFIYMTICHENVVHCWLANYVSLIQSTNHFEHD